MKIVNMDALIKGIQELTGENDVYLPISFINEFAENYIVDTVPKWIPCKEKLPEYLDYVLLSSSEYGLKIGARSRKSNVNSWYLNEPLDCDVWHVILSSSWYDLEDFIAWMPLPEPYIGERKEDETYRC